MSSHIGGLSLQLIATTCAIYDHCCQNGMVEESFMDWGLLTC